METEEERKKSRLNFRFILFCALGLVSGMFLYEKGRFGGLVPSDFLFPVIIIGLALFPISRRRALAVLLTLTVAAGAGALLLHAGTERYLSAEKYAGAQVRIGGTVIVADVENGYSVLLLDNLAFDDRTVGGKLRLELASEEVRVGDVIAVRAVPKAMGIDGMRDDPYLRNAFASDIRYEASASGYLSLGRSTNVLLRLNGAMYDVLTERLGGVEGELGYVLLTGSAGNLDDGLHEQTRRGGIAHIFAVSGLHIGIFYGALSLCSARLKKWRFLPPLVCSFLYSGVCGSTVSAVRAVIMCGALGVYRAVGRKHDLLNSLSLAALIVFLFLPQQWLAVGARLSFGALAGLALFGGGLTRLFKRLKCPRFLREYLSMNLSVLLFTLPILLDGFGYFSIWSILLNFLLLPVLPVFYLTVLGCTVLSLILPFAARVFLFFPAGMLAAFSYFFWLTDVSYVVAGFALGAGGTVWLIGAVVLSDRVRLTVRWRAIAFVGLAALFTALLVWNNVVFSGVRIDLFSTENGSVALISTPREHVLVLDGDINERRIGDFLNGTYGGKLDGVLVLAEDEVAAINGALFLGTPIYAYEETETGLAQPVLFGKRAEFGPLSFVYESRTKLVLAAEGSTVEIDFDGTSALFADYFIGEGHFRYRLHQGKLTEEYGV